MKHFVGLDISVKETAVCVVDETGRICREVKVVSHPDDIIAVLKDSTWNVKRIGLEAGPLSQWLFEGLARAGLPVICIETRRVKAFLKAQPNKTDRNDARGIAQMMRVNLFRPVHIKTLTSQKRRALLTARKILQEKAIAIENDMRGLLRNFGLKVGAVGTAKFEDRIRELVECMPDLEQIMEPLLATRRKLREEFAHLHRQVLAITRDDATCRRLMTVPGVGSIVALAHTATIDIPQRFRNSKAVGPILGLTPKLDESGESKRVGCISPRRRSSRSHVAWRSSCIACGWTAPRSAGRGKPRRQPSDPDGREGEKPRVPPAGGKTSFAGRWMGRVRITACADRNAQSGRAVDWATPFH